MNTAATTQDPATLVEVEPNIFEPLSALVTLKPDSRLVRRAAGYMAMVQSFVIATRDDYELAAEELANVKRAWKGGEAERTEVSSLLNLVLDKWNAKFTPSLKVIKQAEDLWKAKMIAFDAEQARIKAVRLREAERVAQLERDRLAAEARERQRVAQVELDRLAAIERDRVAAAKAEQARIDAEVATAQAAGNAVSAAAAHTLALATAERNANAANDAAAAVAQVVHTAAVEVNAIEQLAAVVIAAPLPEPIKVAGLSTVKGYDFELVSLLDLATFIVAQHPEYISLLMLDTVTTRAMVKSLGMNLNAPGLRVFPKSTLRQTSGAT